jgi:hypothetical protein
MEHKAGPEPGVETARQVRAFQDYWCLGPLRSLGKLATGYRRKNDGGEDVPTVRERTLEEWSGNCYWPPSPARLVRWHCFRCHRVTESRRSGRWCPPGYRKRPRTPPPSPVG